MSTIRHDWTTEELLKKYHQPFMELLYEAATVHRKFHDPNQVQVSSLVSIKTGGCPEDCGYCPQAARYHTYVDKTALMTIEQVKELALKAKESGSSRVCLGAAWRNVKDGRNFDTVLEMVREVNNLDMEVCCTLGMVTKNQSKRLEEAGLYAYNHNIDTSENYYSNVISTRAYQDRLDTIKNIRNTTVTLCSGGIIGMGEEIEDRARMLVTLSSLRPHPESVPINLLVPVEGTPLAKKEPVNGVALVRMIAITRIAMPKAQIRLSAGRDTINLECHALCFFAGANSIFAGEKLLTAPNVDSSIDQQLFKLLDLTPQKPFQHKKQPVTVAAGRSSYPALGETPRWSRPSKNN